MRRVTRCVVLLLIVFSGHDTFAQHPPFFGEIQQFKKQDSVQKPPANAILFIGSSTFRMWKGLQDSFPNRKIVNRAFGGSTFPNLIYYANDVISPYKPKQVLVYC